MEEDHTERRALDFIEKMKKQRGYLPPTYSYVASKDVEFMEAYDNLFHRAVSDGQALSAKTKAFVIIGILAYRGHDAACYNHIKRALALGATKQEVLEAIEATIVPGGTPTFGAGMKALLRVEEEGRSET